MLAKRRSLIEQDKFQSRQFSSNVPFLYVIEVGVFFPFMLSPRFTAGMLPSNMT